MDVEARWTRLDDLCLWCACLVFPDCRGVYRQVDIVRKMILLGLESRPVVSRSKSWSILSMRCVGVEADERQKRTGELHVAGHFPGEFDGAP